MYGCVQRVARSEALAHSKTKGEKRGKRKKNRDNESRKEKLRLRKKNIMKTYQIASAAEIFLVDLNGGRVLIVGSHCVAGRVLEKRKISFGGGEVGGRRVH